MIGDHPSFEDGDILVAKNRRSIRAIHAEDICWPRQNGKKVGGLIENNFPLLEILFGNVYQYKFQRVSTDEVKRITIATGDEDVLSKTPNADGEAINVKEYVNRRKAAAKKPIFGAAGSEIWYGGRISAGHTQLDRIWQEIESRTAKREQDHVNWPFTPRELQRFLAFDVDDFDNQEAGELVAPLVDESDPDNPVTLKKRKNYVEWRGLRDVVESNVLDSSQQIDIRSIRKHVRSQIAKVKS